jgi:hypothetical protein
MSEHSLNMNYIRSKAVRWSYCQDVAMESLWEFGLA